MLNTVFLESRNKFTNYLWLYFGIIVLLNFIFKITDLGFSSYWYDEIISVQSASLDFGHIKHVSEWDKNPPFYYYCLSVWIKLFNDAEFTVRLLSVAFSSLAGGLLFLIANKYFNKATAIIASMLFISSNVLFYYSHEARAYSLVLMLVLLSTAIYFRFKENPTIINVFLLGLVNFLLIYTHYIAGLVLLFQTALMLFYFNKNQKKYFSISLVIVLALTAIRFTKKQILLIVDFNSSNHVFWLKKSDCNYLVEVLSSFLFNNYVSILFLVLILIVIGFVIVKKANINEFYLIYSICIGLGSIILLYVLGKITPIFLERYLIFSLPFLFILVAYGLSFIKLNFIPVLLTGILLAFSMCNMDFKTEKKMDYRGTVNFIKSIKNKDDLIIVKTKDIKPLFCYYYDNDFFSAQKKDLPIEEQIVFCNSWQDLGLDVKNYKRIIVIDSYQEYNLNEKEFVFKLTEQKKNCFTTSYYTGVRISVYK